MRSIRIVHLVFTFCIGLFAGLLYTFEQGVIPTLNTLTAVEYAKVEQGLIRALDAFPTGVIVVANLAMLLPLYPLVRLWKERRSSYWRLTALGWAFFFFGVGIFTIVLNVPINNAVLTWNPAAPPADWETARITWNTLNAIRTPINFLSFLLMIWAAFELPKAP
ncbi:MAG: anthrone oxygenase family protein [Caldilinea sp.]